MIQKFIFGYAAQPSRCSDKGITMIVFGEHRCFGNDITRFGPLEDHGHTVLLVAQKLNLAVDNKVEMANRVTFVEKVAFLAELFFFP